MDVKGYAEMRDQTLADYIKRTMASLETDNQKIAVNRNVWNDPELAKQDIYNVYPEDDGTDTPKNPYSNV
jgi:hypothetical protein